MKQERVTINDHFWNYYRDLVKNVMIPYQWRVLNDEENIATSGKTSYYATEKSHALENLRIAAGLTNGEFHGQWFQDSDVYKWLEAAAYVLGGSEDQGLRQRVDQVIDLIAAAQQDDGYLDTYFQLKEPTRKLQHVAKSHELYCMGHYIEAGCALYQAIDSQKALDIAVKMADFIDAHFGPEEGKLHGYPGHPEIELALMKLADTTQNEKYLKLAAYMVNTRGTQPNFFTEQLQTTAAKEESYWGGKEPALGYFQADVPVREIEMAEGHAVRMVYLLTGMAHVARETHDQSLQAACERLYHDIVDRQMYVTGGVGATANGEAFTFDNDLPNDTAYAETCASCGMVFFLKQMLENQPDAQYADVMERELFNGTISGMALDGQHFFYVNPLEVDPVSCAMDPNKHHVLPTRPTWLACACCPPNLARLLSSLDRYVYTVHGDTVYLDQFISSQLVLDNGVQVEQQSNYPWDGQVTITVTAPQATDMALGIRMPEWCHGAVRLTENGVAVPYEMQRGYMVLAGTYEATTTYVLDLPMQAEQVTANPAVKADIGKVALQRGPIVYCLEEVDNGPHLPWVTLSPDAQLTAVTDESSLSIPFKAIETVGKRLPVAATGYVARNATPVNLRFVPYFAWANRMVGEMLVWVKQR